MCHTGSIAQVHRQLNNDGYHVSENTLRAWIKQGLLPAAYNGRKAYIAYDNVVHILTNGTGEPPANIASEGIRRIN